MRMARAPRAPRGKLVVELSAVPNPDFEFGWNAEVDIPPRYVAVSSLRDASKVAQDFIRREDLGGGNWTGGAVFNDQGKQVARISYNGRVWEPGPWQSAKEIKVGSSYRILDYFTGGDSPDPRKGWTLKSLPKKLVPMEHRVASVARQWMRRVAKFDVFDHDALVEDMKAKGLPTAQAENIHIQQVKEHARKSKFIFRLPEMQAMWDNEISGQITDGIWGGPGGGYWRLYWGWLPTATGGGTVVKGSATSSTKTPPGFVPKLMSSRGASLLKIVQRTNPGATIDEVEVMLLEIKDAMDSVKKDPLRAPEAPAGNKPKTDIERIEHELRWKFGLKNTTMVFSQILVGRYGRRTSQYHFFAIYEDHDTGEFVGGNAYGTFGKPPKSVQLARDADLKKVKRKVQSKINKKLGDYEPKDDLLPNQWRSRGWSW